VQALDSVLKIAGVVGAILSLILSAKLFGPERRKTEAESRGTEASSAKVISEAAILWSQEWKTELDELRDYVDALEDSIDAWTEWARSAAILLEQGGLTLPARPPRPKRPPRHPRPS
jgi:hypothetical protein